MIEREEIILFASSNVGKRRDIVRFLDQNFPGHKYAVLLPNEYAEQYGLAPLVEEVEETGETYEANALLKAQALHDWSNAPTLSDDSGLEVAALHGAPGLYSARYAGEGCTFDDNIKKLLGALEGVKERSAKFVSVLSYVQPDHPPLFFRGELHGRIVESRRGEGGFGYDPVFEVEDTGMTLSELKSAVDSGKPTGDNGGSPVALAGGILETHRSRALKEFIHHLQDTNHFSGIKE